eukprot:CAMPEP_0113648916 /NCGR_PEP_ID=MMETSP0017_2-20120614/25974_1 /TAXON_ID=2856 /ORGANISM="Cylindrotheca closterium" /LENGTH=1210 /DNA_ID=CAMNT_0000561221 /DNA_START=228 /DNA_END=3860 /DNA_ORIENTATION=- /assembly_acc=CAM_ASM_000147
MDCIKLEEVIFGGTTVTFIGEVAFYGCQSLREINIPRNLNRIEPGTFCSCEGMMQVNFTQSLKFIGNAAFAKCTSLKGIQLPPNLVCIDSDAFHSCTSIAEVTFGQSLESIGSAAFANCERLKEIHLPPFLNRIENKAFLDCIGAMEITFNNSLQVIGIQAFQRCGFVKVVLPPSLKVIEKGAFSSCKSLIEADFSKVTSLERMGENVLRGCSSIEETLIPSTASGPVAIHDFLNTSEGQEAPSYVISARVSSSVVREDNANRAFEEVPSQFRFEERLLFLGRYEFASCPLIRKSPASIVIKARDTKMTKYYESEFDKYRTDESANELTREQFANALRDMKMVQNDSSTEIQEYIARMDSSISREEFIQFCLEKFGQMVALKFMRKKGQYLRELNRRSEKELDKCFVVPTIANHDEDNSEDLASQLNDALGLHLSASEIEKYRHIIVMPFADRTLDMIFRTERQDVFAVRKMAMEIGEAVAHLHSRGIVHGDLKLSNIVQVNGRISLINLDSSAEIVFGLVGSDFSSGLLPPEMIHRLADNDETEKYLSYFKEESEEERRKREPRYSTSPLVRGYVVRSFVEDEIDASYENPETGEMISTTKSKPRRDGLSMYKLVRASRAFDVWSFGVLLYTLCCREPLFKVNSDDDITDGDSMWKLHNWGKLDVETIVERKIRDKAAKALLKRILKKSPAERPTMEDILQDDFFNAANDTMQTREGVEVMHQARNLILENQTAIRNGFLTMRESRKHALHCRKKANDLLDGIRKGGMVPNLFLLLPLFEEGDSKKDFSRFLSNFKGATSLTTKARLYFVCPISLQPVLGSNGEAMGNYIVLSNGWVRRYRYAILVGLMTVQVGLTIGRGYGLPMTGTDEDLLELFNFLSEMQDLIIEGMREDHEEAGPAEIFLEHFNDRLDAKTTSEVEARKAFQYIKDKLQNAYEWISLRVKEKDGELKKCGLVRTSSVDGSEEFVHPDMAPLFEKWGSKCFEMSMEELEKEKALLAAKAQKEKINSKKSIPAPNDPGQEVAEQRTIDTTEKVVETEAIISVSPSTTDTRSLQSMVQSKEGLQQDAGQKSGSIVHKGWLRIQSRHFPFRWKERYVVVSENGNVAYYHRATAVHDPSTCGSILHAVKWGVQSNGCIELRTKDHREGVLIFKARLSERSSSTLKDWLRGNQWMLKAPKREGSNNTDTASTNSKRATALRLDFSGQIIKS